MILCYRLDGHTPVPTDSTPEAAVFADVEGRRVGYTELAPEVYVSTVFLVADHGYGEGAPVLFETMVFGCDLDGAQERYSTWDAAEAGHAAMVERVRAALGEDHA